MTRRLLFSVILLALAATGVSCDGFAERMASASDAAPGFRRHHDRAG